MTQFLARPSELTQPIHFQIKAAYMYQTKEAVQDKINEAAADNEFKGYAVPKSQFLAILQQLL